MANDEHVALLKQGVAAWNAWRDENRGADPQRGGPPPANLSPEGVEVWSAFLDRFYAKSDENAPDLSEANLGGMALSEPEIKQLRELSDACGGWIVYDDDLAEIFVPLTQWLTMFAAHANERRA